MVAAVLLAAGAGTRFSGDAHKLRADLRGEPLALHALRAVAATGMETFVVVGAEPLDDLVATIDGTSVRIVENPAWRDGQAASVRAGIAAASQAGHDAVVVGLADQPFVTSAAWRAVAGVDADVAVATYAGRRGHPVRLGRAVWHLIPESGDAAGRVVMASRPELVRPVPCEGDAADVDTWEDLRRWS